MLWCLNPACFPVVCYHTYISIFKEKWHDQLSRLYLFYWSEMNSSCKENSDALSYFFFYVILPIYPLQTDLVAHRTWDYLIRNM